jgi:AAA+ ATPase superfamily predicted ATPase
VRELWRWESPEREIETAPRYDNWLDVFRAMRRLAYTRRVNIILDEFPWAVKAERDPPPRLQAAWDSLFRDSQIRLFLAGSHISAMEALLKSEAPLFGRMTGKLYVPPFPFVQIKPFVPRYDAEKRLAVYAAVGGVPDYLRRWHDRTSLMQNIREIFLSDLSPFRNEADILISDVLLRWVVGKR